MSFGIRMRAEPLKSIAAGSIGAAYMGVGTAFSYPIRAFHIQNLTDATLLFSYDGLDDHFRLPRNGYFFFDVTANKSTDVGCFWAIGDRIYVKEDETPSTGTVDLTAYYAQE